MFLRSSIKRSTLIIGRYFSEGSQQSRGSVSSSKEVPGLSNAVIHHTSEPVGPGVDPSKNGPYKVPEYFCYDNMSFFEAEIEMAKYRLPQPSAIKK